MSIPRKLRENLAYSEKVLRSTTRELGSGRVVRMSREGLVELGMVSYWLNIPVSHVFGTTGLTPDEMDNLVKWWQELNKETNA